MRTMAVDRSPPLRVRVALPDSGLSTTLSITCPILSTTLGFSVQDRARSPLTWCRKGMKIRGFRCLGCPPEFPFYKIKGGKAF